MLAVSCYLFGPVFQFSDDPLNFFQSYIVNEFALPIIGCFPGGSRGKESTCNAGAAEELGSIRGLVRSLEEGMATHSKILCWRIPWTEKPGGMLSMGWQRVGHN